ncbi:MAG: DASS family sodium-coupled anion symporter [Lautropia sp.]|nr:DASS family sodium-coupled anion symporter [Lautropia sp.]
MSDAFKTDRRGWLILAADIVLFALLLRALPFSPEENRGLAMLVFVGILWLTEAFHITVTALMIPLMAIGLGILTTQEAFAPFAEPVIFMFFGGFAIAAVLHVQKLDLWIAAHVIRLAGGSLRLTVIYLFATTAFLSLFVNNTAVAAMMLPLTTGILSQVDIDRHRKLHAFVLLGIAFSASIGGIGTLVGSTPNALLATMVDISFAQWLAYGMPVVALLLPAMVLSLWLVLRPDFNVTFSMDLEEIPLTGRRIFTLVAFATTAVLLILSKEVASLLQQGLALSGPIKNMDSVIAMLAVVVMCVGGSASWKQVQEKTEWGVLMLFGGGLGLSIVMKHTGASRILADSIVNAVGHQPPVIIMLVLTSFVVLLTEFTSNTATAALLMPIFITVARSLHLPDISMAAIIACGASCAFMLPIATPPNAIVYATGRIRLGEMIRVGLLLNLACILVIGLLAHFFWARG